MNKQKEKEVERLAEVLREILPEDILETPIAIFLVDNGIRSAEGFEVADSDGMGLGWVKPKEYEDDTTR